MKSISDSQLKQLQKLGLSKVQTQLYVTSLQSGVLSVLELSKLTKVNRQQIYAEAEKLVELGLYDITRKQGRKYIAADPSKLLVIAKGKAQEIDNAISELNILVPLLEDITSKKQSKVIVKYYEGLDKIKEAYNNELDKSKNTEGLCFAGSLDHIYEYFPSSYWDKWNRKYVEAKNNSKMIVHYSDIAKQAANDDAKFHRETRFLNQFPLKVNIDIFHNIVLIVSFEEETAIWIESPVLASSYRILFDTLWKQSQAFR